MIEEAVKQYLHRNHFGKLDLKAVLFDMDGVLFDSMKNHAAAWHEAMKRHHMHFGIEEAYLHEGRTGADTINTVSIRQRNTEATEAEIEEIYQEKTEIFNTFPKAERMPGSYELLSKIKEEGLIPVIVTGSGQKSLLERLYKNFPDIFKPELMVTAFDVKHGKPNPEPYLAGLRKAGVNANEAIVVENAPLGVKAGVAAGIFTIAVNTGPLPDTVLWEEGADLLFHSMPDFNNNWESFYQAINKSRIFAT